MIGLTKWRCPCVARRGAECSGVAWRAVTYCCVARRAAAWRGVQRRGAACCGVARRAVAWRATWTQRRLLYCIALVVRLAG